MLVNSVGAFTPPFLAHFAPRPAPPSAAIGGIPAGFGAGSLLAALNAGWITDRLGRRRVLLVAQLSTAAATAAARPCVRDSGLGDSGGCGGGAAHRAVVERQPARCAAARHADAPARRAGRVVGRLRGARPRRRRGSLAAPIDRQSSANSGRRNSSNVARSHDASTHGVIVVTVAVRAVSIAGATSPK
jgi:hypothetical protein